MTTTIEYITIKSGTWSVMLPADDEAEFQSLVEQERREIKMRFGHAEPTSNAESDVLRKMYGVPSPGQLNAVQWKCVTLA